MSAAPHELARQAQRLTRLYILALSAVACLSILGQLLVQWSLDRQLSDSTVVNLAGRQRMLSQRLTKAALALERPSSPEQLAAARQEMTDVLTQWQRADEGLRLGDAGLGLPGRNSRAVQQMLAEIQPHFLAMAQAGTTLHTQAGDRSAALDQLLVHEPKFLAAMDAIVLQYEQEARQRVAWLQGMERGLLLLTLLVLACEGVLIFRPAVRRLRLAATAMEESQRQLEIAKQQADSANEAKSQFLATISHELRNPLQAILGSVELATQTAIKSSRQEHLETISTAARALLVLLNDLLDLARIEAGKLAIVSAPLDPVRLTERTLAMVRPQALAQGLRLEQSFPESLPAGLCGDEIRVQQVLLNLLTNAIKFTPTGTIDVRLSLVREGSDGVRLRWEVSDTGIGIALEQQAGAFDAFTQVAAPALRKGGAGLGLAICKRLVELMQGEISALSQLGVGSTFWFELPLARSAVDETADEPVTRQPSARSLRVLLVDDDTTNLRLLTQLLEVLGHQVVAAEGGAAALACFRESPFDAAILDWQMPDMNGGQLAAALRSAECKLARPRTPLIALSAAAESIQDHATDESRFDHWLTKPAGLADLAEALGNPVSCSDIREEKTSRWTRVLARLGGRRELLAHLARSWCDGLPVLLQELHDAANHNRPGDVARLAHLLAGQAGNFDAHELAAAAQELEQRALANRCDDFRVIGLDSQCRRLADELEPWLEEAGLAVK